jgi:hypothetical protein
MRAFDMILRESEEFLATFDDVHEEILGKIKSILYFHEQLKLVLMKAIELHDADLKQFLFHF